MVNATGFIDKEKESSLVAVSMHPVLHDRRKIIGEMGGWGRVSVSFSAF